MSDNNPEVWIPSKDRIEEILAEELSIVLRNTYSGKGIREKIFMRWVKDNTALLSYLGEARTGFFITRVANDLGLKQSEQGYIKREED
ncbi:MAG TPA: hypothetical protein VHV10_02895 [Ktedonobacteraceae bacterium]|jgi:hypothetical protein|nr:hypothetical protein [Ktedonobacteraceae bacterium]